MKIDQSQRASAPPSCTSMHSRLPRRPLRRCERGGGDFLELLVMIGIFCLVIGLTMIFVGDSIANSFEGNAKTTEARSLKN